MESSSIKLDPSEALLQLSMLKPFYDRSFQSIGSAKKVPTGITEFAPFRLFGCWLRPWHGSCCWRSDTLKAFICKFWCQPLTASNHSHLSSSFQPFPSVLRTLVWRWSMTPSRFRLTAWRAYNWVMFLLPGILWSLYFCQVNWWWGGYQKNLTFPSAAIKGY